MADPAGAAADGKPYVLTRAKKKQGIPASFLLNSDHVIGSAGFPGILPHWGSQGFDAT